MKKFFSLIWLAIVMLSLNVRAYPAPQYRWRFHPEITSCWLLTDCIYYPVGGGWGPITDIIYTTENGDSMKITISGNCCTGNPVEIGHTWEEVSYDNGATWNMLTPTYVPLNIPGGVTSESFIQYYPTSMKPVNSLSYCQ